MLKASLPSSLALMLKIGAKECKVDLPLDKTIHLGRVDPNIQLAPNIDLAQDGPADQGVARLHAAIFRTEYGVLVEDLGSFTGTYINSEKLDPFLPETLKDGDTLQVGKVSIKVHFQESVHERPARHR